MSGNYNETRRRAFFFLFFFSPRLDPDQSYYSNSNPNKSPQGFKKKSQST